jgi:hypothetical protein
MVPVAFAAAVYSVLPEYMAVMVSPTVSPVVEIAAVVATPLELVVSVPTTVVLLPSVKETVSPSIGLLVTAEMRVAESAVVVEEPVIDGEFVTSNSPAQCRSGLADHEVARILAQLIKTKMRAITFAWRA